MPTYEYSCDCGHNYEEFRSITQGHPKKCPECGLKYGAGFEQAWSNYNVTGIVRGNPTTVGQQAELNAKRMGKEQMQAMASVEREKFTGKLPKGAESIAAKAANPWWRTGVAGLPKMDKPLDLTTVKNTKDYIETGKK